MNVFDVDQRSPEWIKARVGMITSSRIAAVCSFNKDGRESAKRKNMKLEVAQELITRRAVEHYVTPAMEFGLENEALARAEYDIRTGNDVQLIGLVFHPELKWAGASPDGMIGQNRFAEFKVPTTQTHLDYLASGVIPSEYIPQMQWQMACAKEIEVNDFVSFDPRLPEELQMIILPLERDEKKIAYYEEQAVIFMEEVIRLVEVMTRNAKGQTLESKLRESIRQARGKYQTDEELRAELGSLEGTIVP